MQFMALLSQHAKDEHSVGFYASALCVTPQYLARIVKQLSGHTVLQWIQKTLLGEVNKLLQNTKLSIQQISDDFGFPDQATFSKFYKRGMGMPPTEYRMRNLI
jgi:AraC-like DNA-binding protein